MSGERLAGVEEIPEAGAIVVAADTEAGRISIILTRRHGRVSAFRNRCPHAGYPLQRADGAILVQESRFLVCGAHGASYAIDTGACAGGPCNGRSLTKVRIEIKDGAVCLVSR